MEKEREVVEVLTHMRDQETYLPLSLKRKKGHRGKSEIPLVMHKHNTTLIMKILIEQHNVPKLTRVKQECIIFPFLTNISDLSSLFILVLQRTLTYIHYITLFLGPKIYCCHKNHHICPIFASNSMFQQYTQILIYVI